MRDYRVVTLRQWRQECGLSQVQMAELLGVQQTGVSYSEHKPVRTLTISSLLRRAEVTRCQVLLVAVLDGEVVILDDPDPANVPCEGDEA